MSDKEFVSGLYVDAPRENAPDFVKCKISIKRKELGNWLRGKEGDWINLDVKVSQEGKWYAEVDNWKPDPNASNNTRAAISDVPTDAAPQADPFSDDIPFMRVNSVTPW